MCKLPSEYLILPPDIAMATGGEGFSFRLWETINAYSREMMISSVWTFKGTWLVPVTVALLGKCSHQNIMLTFHIEEMDQALK